MNYIYGCLNLINDKWYVGQTIQKPEQRYNQHINSALNKNSKDYEALFHKKIREYGIENFKLYVLEEVSDKDKLDEREQYWIKEKHSFVRDNGYNITIGGQKRKNNENYIDARQSFKTQQEINEVINLIKDTTNSLNDIADKLNVSLSLICSINTGKKYYQDNEKYPLRTLKTKINNSLVDNVIKLLKANYTNHEIAEIFQIDDNIVYRINYGKAHKKEDETYPIRKELSLKEQRALKIKELLKEGQLNNKQIATLVNCDPSVVSNINYGKNYYDKNIDYPIRKS